MIIKVKVLFYSIDNMIFLLTCPANNIQLINVLVNLPSKICTKKMIENVFSHIFEKKLTW